jgi:hypothetical protein
MTEIEIVQDLFDALGIHGTLQWPVHMAEFVPAAQGLRQLGRDPASDPRHVMQCIERMCRGIGSPYFKNLIDNPADVDDLWVSCWCPQPPGVELHKADCPAGCTPLWTNGSVVVFCRPSTDKHGNGVFDFGIHSP